MAERDEKRGGSGCAIGCLLMFLVSPVLYVLSIGPAVWIAGRFRDLENVFFVIYYPVQFLANYCQPFSDAVD